MGSSPDPFREAAERRRAAAERMRGMFSRLAPGRSLADELIAERRAEARADDEKDEVRAMRMTETLDAIPGAWQRTREGLTQSERGEGIPLDELD